PEPSRMKRTELDQRLPAVVQSLVSSVRNEPRMQHLNRIDLPSRDAIIEAIHGLRELIFPGYFGKPGLTAANVEYRIGELLTELAELLYVQVRCCLRYRDHIPEDNGDGQHHTCDDEAANIVGAFFERIPHVRELIALDVQAAFDS